MDSISKTMDANTRFRIIRDNGYAVYPEYIHHLRKWEIVVAPWDYIHSRKRPGTVKRTGYFFKQNDCVCSQHRETEYERKMIEVQMKLVEHFKKGKKLNT